MPRLLAMSEYYPVAHLGEPKRVANPIEGFHIFNPDHNLYCEDCGYGELQGEHGIIGIVDGKNVYETPEMAAEYRCLRTNDE
jgi:hypothetical protein